MKKILLIYSLLLFIFQVKGQTFCLNAGTKNYLSITPDSVLTDTVPWDDASWVIPIGFDFSFLGKSYDTLTIESNGKIFFSDVIGTSSDPTINIWGGDKALIDFIDRGFGTTKSKSTISYKNNIGPNKIDSFLVIQFENIGFYKQIGNFTDSLSFQLILFKNNQIEIHIGSNHVDTSSLYGTYPKIGLGNEYDANPYYLSGAPDNPTPINKAIALDTIPSVNQFYKFTPIDATTSMQSVPSPACFGSSTYQFTSSVSHGGYNAAYQWYLNNQAILGATTLSYLHQTPVLNDSIYFELQLQNVCNTALPIQSNKIILSQPKLEVNILSNGTSICEGDSLYFYVQTKNAGENPSFKWMVNNQTYATNKSNLWIKDLVDLDTISCEVTSTNSCLLNNKVISDSIVVTIFPKIFPTIEIQANKDTLCQGDSIRFEVIAMQNQGSIPEIKWFKNKQFTGVTGTVFKDKNFGNNDTVYCTLNSDVDCSVDAISNKIAIKLKNKSISQINIIASNYELCDGTLIEIDANTINAGIDGQVSWFHNNSQLNIIGNKLSITTLKNQDSIFAVLVSSLACVENDTSTALYFDVFPNLTPSAKVIADKDSICVGALVNYEVDLTNVNHTVAYQWYKNSSPIGLNQRTFSSATLTDSDIIYCVTTINAGCYSTYTVMSDTIDTKVFSILLPTVAINADKTTLCENEYSLVEATLTHEGYEYQLSWYLNNEVIAGNTSSVILQNLNTDDKLYCELNSGYECPSVNPVNSSVITYTVITEIATTVNVIADKTTICTNGEVNFEAQVEGTNTPQFDWKLNNKSIGLNNELLTLNGLKDGDKVYCEIPNAISCSGNIPSSNLTIINVLNTSNSNIEINISQEAWCDLNKISFTASTQYEENGALFNWFKNNQLDTTTKVPSLVRYQLKEEDLYYCELINPNSCNSISNTIEFTPEYCLNSITSKEQLSVDFFPNPFEDQLFINSKLNHPIELIIYDIHGIVIYKNENYKGTMISTTDWSSGLYVVKIVNQASLQNIQVIKK